ncbi:MAG: class I SAM-dependent methyltransferase [Minwuia sp.]|uniref:class I SAM-dependent methyltransferase n=1 Tax=Minwuia sp. TaxID=2493630 RepID=UPI003A8B861A
MNMGPTLQRLYDCQIEQTPKLKDSIDKRIKATEAGDLAFLDGLADMVIRLAGGELARFCKDYGWICDTILREEIHFRRNGAYRLSRFEDAVAEVYSRPEVMAPYMNGLLMTQVWWPNHTRSVEFLKNGFLPRCRDGYRMLEIGPGHGLFMYFPAIDPRCSHLEGWDLSETSIEATRESLSNLGVGGKAALKQQDLFDAASYAGGFDALIFSEVLEHLDRPKEALEALRELLSAEGKIYIHMPINAPAPDHLFNLDSPEDVSAFVQSAGFRVIDSEAAPMLGYTLERALKMQLTISCLVIAERA